jgi:hypothetical protein
MWVREPRIWMQPAPVAGYPISGFNNVPGMAGMLGPSDPTRMTRLPAMVSGGDCSTAVAGTVGVGA